VDKTASLADAIGSIPNGGHVALGGFAITRCVVAAAYELVRAQKKNLVLTQVIAGMDTDILVGGGCVRRLIYSGGSLDRFGPLHCVNRAIISDDVEAEEYSSLALTLRLTAGALGLPLVGCKVMLGSDLLGKLRASSEGVQPGVDPFTGERIVMLAPLRPDVAIIHADTADPSGNACIAGPSWSTRETAMAAHRTVVLAEELAAYGEIDPHDVTVMAPFVTAVVHAPDSAFPTAAFGRYDYDREHLLTYADAASKGGDALAKYFATYTDAIESRARYTG
jgi:acyl CoA:acetate/3-ketoacid CoA transferase alpha subunit